MTLRTGRSATGALTCGTRCSRAGPIQEPFTSDVGEGCRQPADKSPARPSTPGISFRLIAVFESDAVVFSPLPAMFSCLQPIVPMATCWPAYSNVPVSVSFTISSLWMRVFLGEAPDLAAGDDRRIVVEIHLADEVDLLALKAAEG